MKVAVSTMDGVTICGHLGRCRNFIIFETEGTEITGRTSINLGGFCPGHSGGHGHGGQQEHHAHNVDPFEGCGAVITQGMGQGMLNALAGVGIQPVITSLTDPAEAVRQYLSGKLSPSSGSSCACGSH